MRYLITLILALWGLQSTAQDWEEAQTFGAPDAARSLTVLSSTDTSFFVPIINNFLADNPDTQVQYLVTGTSDIDRLFRASPNAYDVVISSAMDLQLKIANDGYALQIDVGDHPHWAQWRASLFAFTSEPAAIGLNKAAFAGHKIPQTRQELIQALRARPDVFNGRIGTYDVRQSGLGYLFATQDARASETFWRLTEVMGSLDAQLYCCSGAMIDDLAAGRIAVAYNVLGSYAQARTDIADMIEIVLPADFPTTMMRTGFVARDSNEPTLATAFIQHLIDQQSGDDFPLPSLATSGDNGSQSTITLAPALMTYLDQLKRRTFLLEWTNAIIQ